MFSNIIVCLFVATIVIPFSVKGQDSLPFPSPVSQIRPTLSIYSPSGIGDPPCFIIPGSNGYSTVTPKDLAHVIAGHGAWQVPRVIFITHSFRENGNTPWLHILKNAIMEVQPETTVVLMDWGGGSNFPDATYKSAASNMRTVGIWLANIVKELRRIYPRIHIHGIGNSLGAHLMGVAGRDSGAFNRITGLDPSGPLFEGKNEGLRLQRGDAELVDIIHADGCLSSKTENCWVTLNNHYGVLTPIGTVDFYPNYGELNPILHPLEIDQSHTRAVSLFIASVLNKGLFKTNETLEGKPGHVGATRTLNRIRQVPVTAEMGYWLETNFVPSHIDPRNNFYVSAETLKLAENLQSGGRRKRDLVRMIEDCVSVPANAPKHLLFGITGIICLMMVAVHYVKSAFEPHFIWFVS